MNRYFLLTPQLLILLIFIIKFSYVESHGRLLEPVSRGSRWRYNSSAIPDYNDNEGFCGGFNIQWNVHKGKCGLCGNNYADGTPRNHEFGGKYGEGVVVKKYNIGGTIDVGAQITANHKGHFIFNLCNMDQSSESEECFDKNPLELLSGGHKYVLPNYMPNWFNTTVKIPSGLSCQHCVFRWTYVTGNNWGDCEDGTVGQGCGPQETFKGCSDISVL